MRVLRFLLFIPLFLLPSCSGPEEEQVAVTSFEEFYPKYNAYIASWLAEEVTRLSEAKAALEEGISSLPKEAESERKAKLDELAELERGLERMLFRQSLGDYFSFQTKNDLPSDLKWDNGSDEPEIGDARRKRGGTFRYFIQNFPATLRPFGPEANNSFRSDLYDDLEISLVGLHPETLGILPGVAKEWAVSDDQRTVYFRLDPDARYNDGVAVEAMDVLFGVFIRVSDNVVAPYPKQYFREQFAQLVVYDEQTLAITLADAKPLTPLFAGLAPAPKHFYQEYGPDYAERYQWKVPPTTGAYFVREQDVLKGVSITLTRAKDWWANEKKYYRNLFNPDKIVYSVIRDEAKVFELFKAGEIDYFRGLIQPKYWYEKSEDDVFFDGYIEKHEFYQKYPHIPRGLYLNTAKGLLGDRNVRLGIQHAMNMQRVIDVEFRGDYERLPQFAGGYGEFSEPTLRPREFSVQESRSYFEKAGFVKTGADGILEKADGTRLSVGLSYPDVAYYPRVVPLLKEEARKAGLELRLEGNESTLFYQQTMKKEHEMVFWGWGVSPPFPNIYQFFHSRNAFDEKGNLKQQTNNLNSYANEEMDKYALGVRHARTLEEMRENAWAAQRLIHEEALFVPAWREPFARVGSWRWMRWPDSEETEFCVALEDRPRESYAWWIDEEMKEETLAAKRSGQTFPEVVNVYERYREEAAE